MSWLTAALEAIMKRRKTEMQWQLVLTSLAQPVFDEKSAQAKSNMMGELWSVLSDGVEEELTDEDQLALLSMAGRKPIRVLDDRR